MRFPFGMALLVVCTAPTHQLSGQRDLVALSGMDSLSVSVTINSEARNAGLSSTALRNSVELGLQQAGVVVVSGFPPFDEVLADTTTGVLHINVVALPVSSGFAFGMTLGVLDQVYVRYRLWRELPRDSRTGWVEPNVTVQELLSASALSTASATVWSDSRIATSGRAGVLWFVTEAILEMVDGFVNDYLTANPSRQR